MIQVGTNLEEQVFYIDRAMLKAYADASGDQTQFIKMRSLLYLLAYPM
jgi:hypothetical protein